MCFKLEVTQLSDYFCAMNRGGVEQTRITLRASGLFTATALGNEAKWNVVSGDRICPSVLLHGEPMLRQLSLKWEGVGIVQSVSD
jgi:hypothetical protein